MTPIAQLLIYALMVITSTSAFGEAGNSQGGLEWSSPLVLVQCAWLVLIAIGAPTYSAWGDKNGRSISQSERRGLNLPRGSIRAILALLTVGSFVNVMVLGAPVLGDTFDKVLAAFGALTGSIIGFYFAARASTHLPTNSTTGRAPGDGAT